MALDCRGPGQPRPSPGPERTAPPAGWRRSPRALHTLDLGESEPGRSRGFNQDRLGLGPASPESHQRWGGPAKRTAVSRDQAPGQTPESYPTGLLLGDPGQLATPDPHFHITPQ